MSYTDKLSKIFNDINFLKKLVAVLVVVVIFLQFFSIEISSKSGVNTGSSRTKSSTKSVTSPNPPSQARTNSVPAGGGCGV